MTPEEREGEEKAKVFQNRIIYSLPVHIGLWNEDLALREEKIRKVHFKRDNCMLSIQKTRKMFRNILKTTILALEAPHVLYGQSYQLKACDVLTSKESTGLYLSGVITEREIETVQHFRNGCGLSVSHIWQPCVRNTFKIMGCNEDKTGHQVFYGEDVFIQIVESEDTPLSIQSMNPNTDNFGEHLSVTLSADRDIYCRLVLNQKGEVSKSNEIFRIKKILSLISDELSREFPKLQLEKSVQCYLHGVLTQNS